jgi:hypothetical protein
MSFQELLAELPSLTIEQRDLLRVRLAELAGEEWMDDGALTPEEKALIEERIAEHERTVAAAHLAVLGGTDRKATVAQRR